MVISPFIQVAREDSAQRFALRPRSVCRVGRSSRADLVLTDLATSREHALVQVDEAGFCYVADVGSRNGTRVNGLPVMTPVQLRDGDRIAIGRQELLFRDPGEAAALGNAVELPDGQKRAGADHQREVLVERVAAALWDSRRFQYHDRRWADAGVVSQTQFRELAAVAVDAIGLCH